jgi:ABC-type Fe3+-hydroxamate transport system substrate-binding protein
MRSVENTAATCSVGAVSVTRAEPGAPSAAASVHLTDAAGTVHEPAAPDARIVCLVPSITELVCDLGLAGQLVGRTGFCIHPWGTLRTITKVGGTKDVKLETIRKLAPTHVIVNVDENLLETSQALAEFVPYVIVTHPQTPRDNLDLYRLLGAVFDRTPEADRLCEAFERAYKAAVSEPAPPRRDVLYLIWREPWMTVAPETYIAQTLALFNWRTQPTTAADRYPEIELAAFAGKVDRVLLSSEPYHFHERHMDEVAAAIPGAQVSLIDGEMTSWYGSRAILGLRYLDDYTRGTEHR